MQVLISTSICVSHRTLRQRYKSDLTAKALPQLSSGPNPSKRRWGRVDHCGFEIKIQRNSECPRGQIRKPKIKQFFCFWAVWSSLHDVSLACKEAVVFITFHSAKTIIYYCSYVAGAPVASCTLEIQLMAFQQVASATSKCFSLALHFLRLTNSISPLLPSTPKKRHINIASALSRNGSKERRTEGSSYYSLSTLLWCYENGFEFWVSISELYMG